MDGNKNFTNQPNMNFDFLHKELKFNSTKKMFENNNIKKRRREEEIYGTFYGDISHDYKVNESISNKNSNNEEDIFSNWDFGRKGKRNENVDENPSNNFSTKSSNFVNTNFVKGEKQFLADKINSDPTEKNKYGITMTHRQEKLDSDEEVEKEFLKDYTAEKIEKSKTTKDEKKAEAKLKETFGKGFAMLKKSGYKLGSGLGKNEQGIAVPIEIKKRKRNAGVSNENEAEEKSEKNILNNLTNISKLREKHIEQGKTEIDEFEKILENWEEIKNILISSDIIDFEVDLNTQNYDVTKFISQTRKKENFLFDKKPNSNMNNLFDRESLLEDSEETDKMKEELVKVMKKSKEKVSEHLAKIKSISDSTVNFNYEIENLQEELRGMDLKKAKKEKFLRELNHVINDLEPNLNSDSENIESYIRFASHLIHLFMNNRLQYLEYSGLTSYCLEITEKFLTAKFSFIDYLKKSKLILPLINEIKNLVYKTENEEDEMLYDDDLKQKINAEYSSYTHVFPTSSNKNNDPDHIQRNEKIFGYFLNKIVINNLISYIINEWNVKEYEVLHKVFDIYSSVIPNFMNDYIIDFVLIPRLLEEIRDKWDLNFEFSHYDESIKPKVLNNVYLWIHPWLDIIKLQKLAPISKVIQDKIENKIISCDLGNSNLIDVLQPWKKIWDEEYFMKLNSKYIIPKLNYLFSKMLINPKDQDLNILKILFKWNQSGLLEMEICKPILLKHFFPKWLQTLSDWLHKSPNSEEKFEEIQNWYIGWKSLFSGNYLKFTEIEKEFKNALVLITST